MENNKWIVEYEYTDNEPTADKTIEKAIASPDLKNPNFNIRKTNILQMFLCFLLGCVFTFTTIWSVSHIKSKPSDTVAAIFEARVVDFNGEKLTVQGLPTNDETYRGTYFIKYSKDISVAEKMTNKILEWEEIGNYGLITVQYTGDRVLKSNKAIKGVKQIYCNEGSFIKYW